MKIEKIIELIENKKWFETIFVNGKEVRLFSAVTYVCEFRKNSKRYGLPIRNEIAETWDIELRPKVSPKLMWDRLGKIIAALEKSGLWHDVLESLKMYRNLGFDRFVNEFAYKDSFELERKCGIETGFADCVWKVLYDGIKKVNYMNDFDKEDMEEKLKTRTKYHDFWRKGYDNKISYDPLQNKAWYSEEYKDCGNGHYYLMLNATQAIHVEDD